MMKSIIVILLALSCVGCGHRQARFETGDTVRFEIETLNRMQDATIGTPASGPRRGTAKPFRFTGTGVVESVSPMVEDGKLYFRYMIHIGTDGLGEPEMIGVPEKFITRIKK
jgi:hypothetical protein